MMNVRKLGCRSLLAGVDGIRSHTRREQVYPPPAAPKATRARSYNNPVHHHVATNQGEVAPSGRQRWSIVSARRRIAVRVVTFWLQRGADEFPSRRRRGSQPAPRFASGLPCPPRTQL